MKVSLFITCLADVFYPEVGKSVVQVLREQGIEVDFPAKQTCCGQPAYNSGYHADAKEAAKQQITVFEQSENVITPSGSCAAMIRHYYPDLFADDPEWRNRAQALADKTYEFSEFLVKVMKIENFTAKLTAKGTYHQSCHMSRGLGVKDEPLQILVK